MTATERLLAHAGDYAASEPQLPSDAQPATGVAVVVCMDARIDVYRVLGLEPGDAHVIRNAGGVITDDVIRSLAISQRGLGTTEVILVHHTRCGMLGLDDEAFATEVEQDTGVRPPWRAGGFTDAAEDVRQSIEALAKNPFIPHRDDIRGFVFDVDTGRLEEVAAQR